MDKEEFAQKIVDHMSQEDVIASAVQGILDNWEQYPGNLKEEMEQRQDILNGEPVGNINIHVRLKDTVAYKAYDLACAEHITTEELSKIYYPQQLADAIRISKFASTEEHITKKLKDAEKLSRKKENE